MAETPKSFGQYRLIEKLGQGAMGTVFLAEDTMLQRQVALKVLPQDHTRDEQFLKRFQREARAMGHLNHPNIAGAYAVGEEHGLHYYVMEYCPGEPLDRMLKREGRLPWRTAVELTAQVAEGLAYAHEHDLIHRDIKPANLILTPDKAVKILDLGLSKQLDESSESNFATMAGQALGTPHYMSPEQAKASKSIDGRSDIYSLGATLYHMVTGRTMYQGPTSAVVMAQHLTKTPEDPRKVVPDLPEGVVQVIRKATAREPDDRYGSAKLLLSDLQALLTGAAVSRPKTGGARTTGARDQVPGRTPRKGRTTRQTTAVERHAGERSWSTRASRQSRGNSALPVVLLLLLIGLGAGAWYMLGTPGLTRTTSTAKNTPGEKPEPNAEAPNPNGKTPTAEKKQTTSQSKPKSPAQPKSTRVDRGLIAEYRFTDGPGSPTLKNVKLNGAQVEAQKGLVLRGNRAAARNDHDAKEIIQAIKKSGQFTLDVWVTPTNTSQSGPARITTLSTGTSSNEVNLHLGQEKDGISFRLRTSKDNFSQQHVRNTFKALNRPYHIAITDDGKTKSVYVDGKLQGRWPSPGDFSSWNEGYHLVFGNEHTMNRQWNGTIYSVAFYSTALSLEEIQRNAKHHPVADTGDNGGAQPAQSYVARYSFEEHGRDAAGNHHGKVSKGTTFSKDAREGKRALVCGKDAVTIPDHKDLDIGRGDFAVAFWFLRKKDPRDNLRILSKHNKRWQGYCVRGGDSSIGFDIGNGATRPYASVHTGGLGKWQHFAVNVDRKAGLMKLYLNGALLGTRDISIFRGKDIDSDAPLSVGTGSNLPWNGMIDDVRIYKRTLTVEEIKALSSNT